jgi:hypothetical protein
LDLIASMTARSRDEQSPGVGLDPPSGLGGRRALAAVGLLAIFFALAIGVYRAALRGPFLSDDSHWLAHNPYVQVLSAENLLLIAQPLGESSYAIGNYAPVAVLILGLEYQLFGGETMGYHIVNLFLHALASALLVAALLRSKLPRTAALLGGAFFLVHPANVEAVAWISQLKTTSSMVLGLGALLLFSRHSAWASLLFALALLAKPTAFVALPFLAVRGWSGRKRPYWIWLGVWLLILAIYALPEFRLQQTLGMVLPPETDLGARVRSVPAFAARYLVMAATSWGVSAYHQPELSRSWLDPWWLTGLGLLALLGWRTIWALRRRREEGAWWLWAALSFAPISQVFPFIYPMADRYLYFVLPGLIGGVMLMGRELVRSLIPADHGFAGLLRRGAAGVALVVIAILASSSQDRAGVWSSNTKLFLDGATSYPDGIEGSIFRALRAVRAGDRDAAIQALQTAHARGFRTLESLLTDRALDPLRSDARFEALLRQIAAERVEHDRAKPRRSLFGLVPLAEAHLVLGQVDEAITVLDRAAALRGSDAPYVRDRMMKMRSYAEQERSRRAAATGGAINPAQP